MTTKFNSLVGGDSDLLTRKEAARYLRVSDQTLASWASTGRHNIPYLRLGRMVRYRRSDLDVWLAGRNAPTDGQPKRTRQTLEIIDMD